MKSLSCALLVLALVGCSGESDSLSSGPDPTPVVQSLTGIVEFWEGDFMPLMPPDVPSGSVAPVKRTVYIHYATTEADVTTDGPGGFFSEIRTPLVGTVESDDRGQFVAALPAGTYSLFVAEDGRFYANRWSESYIQPVTIKPGQVAEIRIKIDYLATF